jgi:hypothetical protein
MLLASVFDCGRITGYSKPTVPNGLLPNCRQTARCPVSQGDSHSSPGTSTDFPCFAPSKASCATAKRPPPQFANLTSRTSQGRVHLTVACRKRDNSGNPAVLGNMKSVLT